MTWIDKVKAFCDAYNIPYEYLAETLYEPKVIPMIRGKAFEFSAWLRLQTLLPQEEFHVDKISMNAQRGQHDVDIQVLHLPTQVTLSVECKLASKGSYHRKDDKHQLSVKCMRSRTLGAKMVTQEAKKLGIDPDLLQIHNDNYLPQDFDVVLTSLANAFYVTNDTGIFVWQPTHAEMLFLQHLFPDQPSTALKQSAFHAMYVARSDDLAIHPNNGKMCQRKNCPQKTNCGFIPNYPRLIFDGTLSEFPWHPLEQSTNFFRHLAQEKANLLK